MAEQGRNRQKKQNVGRKTGVLAEKAKCRQRKQNTGRKTKILQNAAFFCQKKLISANIYGILAVIQKNCRIASKNTGNICIAR